MWGQELEPYLKSEEALEHEQSEAQLRLAY
jgi:hypothetical protein